MKGKIIFTAISVTILLSSNVFGQGRVVTNNNYDFIKTEERTFKNNRCSRGYTKLKKILKDEAKSYCVREHNSGSALRRVLAVKNWKKIKCTKNKSRHSRTTVTVKGTYKALCN